MANKEGSRERIITAFLAGLKGTYQLHEDLGESGVADFQQNPYGERALVMDVKAEEIIISAFRSTNLAVQIFSEEHGNFTLGQTPKYTSTLDGLDGSDAYKKQRTIAMYGTMGCILSGQNPKYDDYIASGIMIHSPAPELLIAIKGQGCFLVDLITGRRNPIPKREPIEFSTLSKIDLDTNWAPYKKIFEDNHAELTNMGCRQFSQAARTALFVQGQIDIGLEWTRKGNLEQPVTYGLVKEMGGVMITLDGESLGSRRFKTFGQDTNIPLVIAPTQSIAEQVIEKLNLKNLAAK